MKKFWRNMLSGYFLVLLILLIEIGVLIFIQFFLDDVIIMVAGAQKEDVAFIISIVYLVLRAIIFVIAVYML